MRTLLCKNGVHGSNTPAGILSPPPHASRTHTSARAKPCRNERIDATHLAEFHQVEGLICDHGLTLGHLIGVLNQFFSRLGLPKLRFKPAYNPYTEPSMEIFSYSEQLNKWMEVGLWPGVVDGL